MATSFLLSPVQNALMADPIMLYELMGSPVWEEHDWVFEEDPKPLEDRELHDMRIVLNLLVTPLRKQGLFDSDIAREFGKTLHFLKLNESAYQHRHIDQTAKEAYDGAIHGVNLIASDLIEVQNIINFRDRIDAVSVRLMIQGRMAFSLEDQAAVQRAKDLFEMVEKYPEPDTLIERVANQLRIIDQLKNKWRWRDRVTPILLTLIEEVKKGIALASSQEELEPWFEAVVAMKPYVNEAGKVARNIFEKDILNPNKDGFTARLRIEKQNRTEPEGIKGAVFYKGSDENPYDEIGGMDDQIALMREMIEWPLLQPEVFEMLNIKPLKGFLLVGPPRSGKTSIARAVAKASGVKFYAVNGPKLVEGSIGDGEAAIRKMFEDARDNEPAIIFIDEIDAIGAQRSSGNDMISGDKAYNSTLAALLAGMDGFEDRGRVIVIAATNRPDILDSALRAAGRFDRELMIGYPDEKGRLDILKIHTRKKPLATDVDLEAIARKTERYVGADLEALTNDAAMIALREVKRRAKNPKGKLSEEEIRSLKITRLHFAQALKDFIPAKNRDGRKVV
ncbi:MAG: AAA family ATPase [Deltaproteobacteria bacterium]|nr:AAA family ATPase [Deltaproteobacteria bacterium]